MRQIKFRGKDIETGEWVYGDLIQRMGYMPSIMFPYESNGKVHYSECAVKRETVGQFAELLDKNENEIYEGDIVRNKEIGGYGLEYLGVVRYYEEDCRFGIDTTTTLTVSERVLFSVGENSINDGYCTINYTNEYEVLGNIHDNPEILKNE